MSLIMGISLISTLFMREYISEQPFRQVPPQCFSRKEDDCKYW